MIFPTEPCGLKYTHECLIINELICKSLVRLPGSLAMRMHAKSSQLANDYLELTRSLHTD